MNEPHFMLAMSDIARLQRNLHALKSELDAGPQPYRTHQGLRDLIDSLLDILPQNAGRKLELAPSAPPPPAPHTEILSGNVTVAAGSPSAEEAMAILAKAMPNAGAEITPPKFGESKAPLIASP